jgi:hypothetical protein
MPNPSSEAAPPRPNFRRRIVLAGVLAVAAWIGLPGRIAETVIPSSLDSFWLAPAPAATVIMAATAAMLLGAVVAAALMEPVEADATDERPWPRGELPCAAPRLGVPLTLPSSVSAPAPGSHAVRLTYLPAIATAGTGRPVGIGLPVLAPAAGTVLRVVDGHADNAPATRWGNHVLLRLETGGYVRLGNLACGSIAVIPGQHVAPGGLIGGCGCPSGAGASEMLIQFQDSAHDGAAARPFFFIRFIEFAPSGPRWIEESSPQPGAIIRGVRPIAA